MSFYIAPSAEQEIGFIRRGEPTQTTAGRSGNVKIELICCCCIAVFSINLLPKDQERGRIPKGLI